MRREDQTCTGPECTRKIGVHGAKGLCVAHYRQSRVRGGSRPLTPIRKHAMSKSNSEAQYLVDEYRFMRDYCGLNVARTLLRLDVSATAIATCHLTLGLPVPEEVKALRHHSASDLRDTLDERRLIAG